MGRVAAVCVPLSQPDIGCRYTQDTGQDSLWPLHDEAEGALGRPGPGEAVAVALVVYNDDGAGVDGAGDALVAGQFLFEEVEGNVTGTQRRLVLVTRGGQRALWHWRLHHGVEGGAARDRSPRGVAA